MKFGKEFASQMVQEWQEAYMNYNQLKGILKDVANVRHKDKPPPKSPSPSKKQAIYRAFSGLTGRYTSFKGGVKSSLAEKEDEVILVSAGPADVEEGKCQTIFLKSSEEGGELELVYFRRLDDEFNKVVTFYKGKVEEMMKEAQGLNKQMDALIALRFNIYYPGANDSYPLTTSRSMSMKNRGTARLDAIQETEMSEEGSFNDNMGSGGKDPKGKSVLGPTEVLNHVKINVPHHRHSSKASMSYNPKELIEVEEQMKQAFIVFHQKLRLLKSYCFLNQLAFSKIMKKYDKITSRSASKAYLEMVDNSYLGQSDEVAKLIERVEDTYIKHLSNGNRHKGMSSLRPKPKREKHRTTFFLGLFSGCCLALVVAIILVIRQRNILLNSERRDQFMKTIFPLYTLFGYIVLHMIMYSANIYYWNRFRVNYSFIFGFKPGTELGYREVLLVASGLTVLMLAALLSSLEINMERNTGGLETLSFDLITELVPLILVIVVVAITVCPYNIVYRTNRYFLLVCLWHCVCAPFYKVSLADFFLADQLTSQVQSLRSIEFYACYYATRSNACPDKNPDQNPDKDVFRIISILIAVVPYWLRCLQCLRRLYEERDPMQGLNGLKYFSTIAAVVFRTLKDQRRNDKGGGPVILTIIAASTSGVATIFNTYWDLVIDWGLLNKNSNNPWLRDKLLVPNKFVYFGAMVLNVLLRLAWMQTVTGVYDLPFVHEKGMIALVAVLEILRRGLWNFFRLENEHLNNVGKYRAFKSVPLPFSYEDEDKDL